MAPARVFCHRIIDVFKDYTNSLTAIGMVASGGFATVTVPAGIDTSYVFYMTAESSGQTADMNSSVREDRLAGLGYTYRFLQDDLGAAAVDPEDWPSPAFTAWSGASGTHAGVVSGTSPTPCARTVSVLPFHLVTNSCGEMDGGMGASVAGAV